MSIETHIEDYIAGLDEPKAEELRMLDRRIRAIAPEAELWFLNGKNDEGKIVSNPNIGYGSLTMTLAGGKTRDFYRIGLSANTSGISLYVMGLSDKHYLAQTFGDRIGKASVTGYCIKFKRIADIDLNVFEEIVRFGLEPR